MWCRFAIPRGSRLINPTNTLILGLGLGLGLGLDCRPLRMAALRNGGPEPFLSAMYWHTRRHQFSLSCVSRCNIFYRPVLQLDMKQLQILSRMRCCSFNLVRPSLRVPLYLHQTVFTGIHVSLLMFSVLAYSSSANSYLRLQYLRFPPLRTRTCVPSTCIFNPFMMYCFVLIFSVFAFSNTCDFSASL